MNPESTSNRRLKQQLVILVHGIRTWAAWQGPIRKELEDAGVRVEPVNFGSFSLFKFLLPVPWFRRRAMDRVWIDIVRARRLHPRLPVSFIAHSFGTWLVLELLKRELELKVHRIVLVASVVPLDYPFAQIDDRFIGPKNPRRVNIVAEIGTRDPWPVLAESITCVYGNTGTTGFRKPGIRDRWHNGFDHSAFLNAAFCATYWVPFLLYGDIVEGSREPEPLARWVRLLAAIKIKYILAVLFFFASIFIAMLYQNGRILNAIHYLLCFSVVIPFSVAAKVARAAAAWVTISSALLGPAKAQEACTIVTKLRESPSPTDAAGKNFECLQSIIQSYRNEINALRGELEQARQQISTLQIEQARGKIFLHGAVVAFNRSEALSVGGVANENAGACPVGWTLFKEAGGRAIIGAGSHKNLDMNRKELKTYLSFYDNQVASVGGEEEHILKPDEMPNHSHGIPLAASHFAHGSANDPWAYDEYRENNIVGQSTKEGAGKAHNNMPPFIALYYCIKE